MYRRSLARSSRGRCSLRVRGADSCATVHARVLPTRPPPVSGPGGVSAENSRRLRDLRRRPTDDRSWLSPSTASGRASYRFFDKTYHRASPPLAQQRVRPRITPGAGRGSLRQWLAWADAGSPRAGAPRRPRTNLRDRRDPGGAGRGVALLRVRVLGAAGAGRARARGTGRRPRRTGSGGRTRG